MAGEYSGQMVQVLLELARLKPRVIAKLPLQLQQLKEQIPEVTAYRAGDYDLFLRVSSALYGKGELTMGQLRKALAVPLSTATRLVDWLVKHGYARRLLDPEDRRVVRVTLTDAGRELHQTINRFLQEQVERLVSNLTAEEQKTLVLLLGKIINRVKEEA